MDGFLNSLTESFSETFFGGHDPFRFAQQQAAAFAQHAMPQAPGAAGGSHHSAGNKGAPPASAKALKQLPTITVAPEDLVDENNRECCICLEENHLKDRVFRLPCAHIFHQRCIVDWLTKHCTCPVCRYELETDDPQFERGRRSRMKARKPRVHTYELERMSESELRSLAKEYKVSLPTRRGKVMGKQDIINAFRQSGRVDVIAAPKPVEYALQELRAMGVGKLKRTMEAAGVFFDPVDVVEKDDMVHIFCNSGRLVLIPDKANREEKDEHYSNHVVSEETDRKPAACTASLEMPQDLNRRTFANGLVVETVSDEDEEKTVFEDSNALNMFDENETYAIASRTEFDERALTEVTSSVVETTNEAQQDTGNDGYAEVAQNIGQQDITTDTQTDNPSHDRHDDGIALFTEPCEGNDEPTSGIENEPSTTGNIVSELGVSATRDNESEPSTPTESEPDSAMSTSNDHDVAVSDAHVAADYALFESYSISDLRLCAKRLNVDLSHCIERGEMVDKVVQARASGKRVCAQDLDQWSILELRALSTAVGVDLSHCSERTQMVQMLVQESKKSPHVANYLATLTRLTNLSVAQLRAIAREWKVNVVDCIEKEEMIHRLVKAATPTHERI